MLFGLLLLAAVGRVSNFTTLIAGSLTTLLVVCTLAAWYIVGDRGRINTFFTFGTKVVNRLIEIVRPGHPDTIDIKRVRPLFDELHENYVLFKSKYKELKAPFVYALFANLSEVLAVFVVYLAFGHWVNLGAIISGLRGSEFCRFGFSVARRRRHVRGAYDGSAGGRWYSGRPEYSGRGDVPCRQYVDGYRPVIISITVPCMVMGKKFKRHESRSRMGGQRVCSINEPDARICLPKRRDCR